MYKVCFIGGHFTTAQAVIQSLLQPRLGVKKQEIIFFGKKYEHRLLSQEYKAITAENIKFVKTVSVKINRFFSLKNIFSIFLFPITVCINLYFLLRFSPTVIVGFGGYLSLPVCLAARILGKKILIHEGTVGVGLANRFLARIADITLISFEPSRKFLPNAVLSGCPLRQEIINAKEIKSKIPTILICGGHQGSKIINKNIKPIIKTLLEKYIVIHQTGGLDFEEMSRFKNSLPSILKIRYIVADYFKSQEYANYLANADMVIGRSGINTVSEIIYLKKPAILIPLPFAQMNEQLENARLAKSLNLGVIIEQKDLSPEVLLKNIEIVKNNASGLDNKYQKLFEEAGEKIAIEIVQLLK